jgi:hypothetical protein
MRNYSREYHIAQGARPVINVDGDELGLARNERGAKMVVARLCTVAGATFSLDEIQVVDVGTHWQV